MIGAGVNAYGVDLNVVKPSKASKGSLSSGRRTLTQIMHQKVCAWHLAAFLDSF